MASTGLRFQKTRKLLGDDGFILAMVDSGGWTGTQLGREVHLEAGDAVLCTNAEVASGVTWNSTTVPLSRRAPVTSGVPSARFAQVRSTMSGVGSMKVLSCSESR